MTQVDEGPESLGAPDVLTAGAPRVGEVLAERYELQQHVGNDAFGRQVWRGVDVVLRRPVAVVLRYPGGESAVEMLDAAVAASRVTHSHLVDIYDAIDEGTRAYVVREWVDGRSLRELVLDTPLDAARATGIAHAVAGAVTAFHATGLVHGNIRPGTVLVAHDDRVLLADARSDEVSTLDTDIRAVGAVLYAALTGHWPHAEAGESRLPDALRDATGAPVPARQVRGGVPGHLSDLAMDLLDPQVAPPSADVLSAELARLDTVAEDDEYLADDRALGLPPALFATGPARPEPSRPVGRKFAAAGAALLVLALVGLLVATRVFRGSADDNTTGPSARPSAAATKPAGQPTQLPITDGQVRVIDPPQGDRSELDGVANAVDGKPDTYWRTDHYAQAPFGRKKPGMGILIDLGGEHSVSDVKIDFPMTGATVDLRAGSTAPDASSSGDQQIYQSYKVISPAVTVGSTHDFTLSEDQPPTRYLLIWISLLGQVDDNQSRPYQAGISEIQVFVTG